jgi:hypothetical protein
VFSVHCRPRNSPLILAQSFCTVNGIPANGGSLGSAGPTVAGGMDLRAFRNRAARAQSIFSTWLSRHFGRRISNQRRLRVRQSSTPLFGVSVSSYTAQHDPNRSLL